MVADSSGRTHPFLAEIRSNEDHWAAGYHNESHRNQPTKALKRMPCQRVILISNAMPARPHGSTHTYLSDSGHDGANGRNHSWRSAQGIPELTGLMHHPLWYQPKHFCVISVTVPTEPISFLSLLVLRMKNVTISLSWLTTFGSVLPTKSDMPDSTH